MQQKSEEKVKPERKTRTVDEAAAELGISKNAAYQAIEKGQIPSIRLGRRIVIPSHAFQKLLEG